jgi:uncharacterized protein
MKKSILFLGVALVAFSYPIFAANHEIKTPETNIYADMYATPMVVAISKGEVEVVQKMIKYGANVNEIVNGMTPLMYAARYNQVEIMEILVQAGANVKEKCKKGFTSAKYAELSNASEATDYLKSLKSK